MKDLTQNVGLYMGTTQQVSVLTLCLEALWGAPLNRTCYNSLIKFGLWTAGFEKVYNRPWEWGEKCVSEEDAGHELCKQCSLKFSCHPINMTFSTTGLGSFHRRLPFQKTLLSSEPSSKQSTPWTDFQDYKFPSSLSVWCRLTAKNSLRMFFWQCHPQKSQYTEYVAVRFWSINKKKKIAEKELKCFMLLHTQAIIKKMPPHW